MPKPTAGWSIQFGATPSDVGILHEFDVTFEGDEEEYSGTNSTVTDGVVRQIHGPVDVGALINFSGKIDEGATEYANFKAAMEDRTPDTSITLTDGTASVVYTGHSNSYSESMSRSEKVWNFSATFRVNSVA